MTRGLSAALLSTGLLAMSARPWGTEALAWVALTPAFLAVATQPRAPLAPARAGLLCFVAALGLVAVAYEAVIGLSVAAYLATVPAAALPFGAAGAAAAWIAGRLGRTAAWAALPVCWCAAEVLARQEWLWGGWALTLGVLGYTQAGTPAVHLARLGSVSAVSLAILLCNALLAAAIAGPGRRRALLGLALVAAAVWGAWRTAPPPLAEGTMGIRIALLQPALPSSARVAADLHPGVAAEVHERLERLALAATPSADLHVWPEAVWPGRLYVSAQGVAEPAPGWLAGWPPSLFGAAATVAGLRSNAAFTWSESTLSHAFDKRHLVPVVEDGLAHSSAPVVLELAGVLVAPLICYDVVFPATVRAAARGGAQLLAVIADDGFAAGSHVPLQHLRVARLRAVESGLWLAFASNGGPSALVDPAGRLAALTPTGEESTSSAMTRPGSGSTPYLRYGDWVGALACLLAAGMAGIAGRKGGATRPPPST